MRLKTVALYHLREEGRGLLGAEGIQLNSMPPYRRPISDDAERAAITDTRVEGTAGLRRVCQVLSNSSGFG